MNDDLGLRGINACNIFHGGSVNRICAWYSVPGRSFNARASHFGTYYQAVDSVAKRSTQLRAPMIRGDRVYIGS